jgi:hypothetical protein
MKKEDLNRGLGNIANHEIFYVIAVVVDDDKYL